MKKVIAIFAILLVIVGCVTTKDKNYSRETETSSVDSLTSVITDSIKKVYEEKYREIGFYVDFYNDNTATSNAAIDEMQNALLDSSVTSDSLRKMIKDFKCPENTVKYNADGSVEFKGKIKSLSSKVLDLQKSLDSARIRTEKVADVKLIKAKEIVTITKTKKTKPIWWLYIVLLVIGYIVGGKFPLPKLLPAVKKFIPWI